MTAPETYTVDRDTLERLFFAGFQSGALTAAVSLRPDEASQESAEAAGRALTDVAHATIADQAWRLILGVLSGARVPGTVVTVHFVSGTDA